MPQTKQRELGETTESGSLQGPIDHLEQSNALGQVQFKGRPATDPLHVAAEGVSGSAHALPHSDRIQESFGSFDIRGITAYTGPQAQSANADMGSSAFATGSSVAFAKGSPDLHTAAHEAAHVVQQQQGVSLKEGVGQVGDRYEQHADEVADAVVAGKSTEGLLGEIAPGGGGTAVQFDKPEKSAAEDTKPSHSETAPKADDVVGGVGGLLEYQGLLRELYNKADAAIDAEILYMQSKGVPEEQIAKWAVKARNEAKVKIRKWDPAKTWAEQRNLAEYGDKVGPSHSQLKNGDPSHKIKPKSNKQIIEGATRTNTGLNTWAGRLRIAGRIMLAVDLVISGYRVAVAPPKDRPKVFIKEATGLAGALAGGLLGAKGGSMVGGTAGAAFAGVGAAPGAAAGGILGAIGGAIAGAWGGAQVGNWLVEELYPPTDTGFEQ